MKFYLSLCLALFIQLESGAQPEKKRQQDEIDSKALGICGSGCSEGTIKQGKQESGLAFFTQKKFLKAKERFLLSLEISGKQKDARLSEIYKKQNDSKNPLFFLEKYNQLRDNVYSGALIKNLAKMQTDYAENVKAIKAKDQVLLLNEELIKDQKLQMTLIATIAALSLFLAGILYKFYRDKLQINIKLDQKVKELAEGLQQNNSNANEKQQTLLQKIGSEGQAIVSGVKRLCYMVRIDSTEKAEEYFQKVD